MVREEVPAQAVFRLHTCGRWGKKCERIEWTIVLCRRCYPRGGSSPRATEENADVQSESNVTIGSLPRAAEENADIQSESNVNNSASASAVNAVVQAGTLEEPLPGPQVPGSGLTLLEKAVHDMLTTVPTSTMKTSTVSLKFECVGAEQPSLTPLQ